MSRSLYSKYKTYRNSLLLFAQKLITKFFEDETTTLAASVAYYTALSLAPLLILFVTLSAHLNEDLRRGLVREAQIFMAPEAANAIESILLAINVREDLHTIAGIGGMITLLISSSLIFGVVRQALNRIFQVKIESRHTKGYLDQIINYLKDQLLHISLAMLFVAALATSVAASSFISTLISTQTRFSVRTLNIVISYLFYSTAFTLIFRYVPGRYQVWRRALRGGLLTGFLFVIGQEVVGIYLGQSALSSTYGAAGSLIVMLVWVYYSALITFIGAQASTLMRELKN